jgi:beta-lactamase regulating signal transducer with metallopeptidase domain
MRTIFSNDILRFGTSVFVDASWKGLLLLLVATVAAFAANKSSAAVRHRIWCLSLSALLLLPILRLCVPHWNVALPGCDPTRLVNVRDPANSWSPADISDSNRANRPESELPSQVEPADLNWFSVTSPIAILTGSDETHWPADALIPTALVALWVVVSLTMLGRLMIESTAVYWIARRCRPLPGDRSSELLADLRVRLNLRCPVRLLECDEAIVPFTCGLVRPVVLLPAASREWSLEQQRCVLLHELAHVKRFDVFVQMVARAACSFYWFNPLAWYALRRLRIERELACDDCVVAAGENPVNYADQLVEIARSCLACRYAIGVAIAGSSNLEERIMALLDRARSHRLLSRPLSSLLSLAMLLLVIVAATFQPVARAAGGNSLNLEQRSDRPVSGAKVLAQADSEKRDGGDEAAVADCVRDWRTRAKMVANLRVSWTQTETILKGRLPHPQFGIPLPPKNAVIPPTDTTLTGTFNVVLSGGKIRYEEKTDSYSAYTNTQGIQEDVRVWDGRHYVALFAAGTTSPTYPYGEVQERDHSSGVTRERNIIPLSLFFRILDKEMGQLRGGKLHFDPGTTVIEGRTCRTLKDAGPNGVTAEFSLDPQRGYIPLAYTVGERGRPGLHLTVNRVRELPDKIWAPMEWRCLFFGDDGNLTSEVVSQVTSCELPNRVDDAKFKIKFPPGTWVVEQEGKRQYVIQASGFERRVPKGVGSSKYSWLMNPANNN